MSDFIQSFVDMKIDVLSCSKNKVMKLEKDFTICEEDDYVLMFKPIYNDMGLLGKQLIVNVLVMYKKDFTNKAWIIRINENAKNIVKDIICNN